MHWHYCWLFLLHAIFIWMIFFGRSGRRYSIGNKTFIIYALNMVSVIGNWTIINLVNANIFSYTTANRIHCGRMENIWKDTYIPKILIEMNIFTNDELIIIIMCHSLYRQLRNIQNHLENNLSPIIHLFTHPQQFRKTF